MAKSKFEVDPARTSEKVEITLTRNDAMRLAQLMGIALEGAITKRGQIFQEATRYSDKIEPGSMAEAAMRLNEQDQRDARTMRRVLQQLATDGRRTYLVLNGAE